MPNLKDVVMMVLVVVLLASLGYGYIVLPTYQAEKKRRQGKKEDRRK